MTRLPEKLGLTLTIVAALAVGCSRLTPPGNPVPVDNLVHLSPCDILPENKPVVGSIAHPNGYPRWNGNAIEMGRVPRLKPDTNVSRNLIDDTTFANEVHDCQRLVVEEGDTLAFGPLVGLLPLKRAMTLTDAEFLAPQAVATVYNWGGFHGENQEYDSLGIEHRRNCLWLHETAGAWRAAMTQLPHGSCSSESPPGGNLYTLDVQRAVHAGPMPATARWEWSEPDSLHMIGIKCGSAWCRIGSQHLGLADSVDLPPADARSTIPGYFDAQHLAVPGGRHGIIPGPLAMITPTDTFFAVSQTQLRINHAGSNTDVMGPAFEAGLQVATIVLLNPADAVPPTYQYQWGVDQTPVTLNLTMVVKPSAPMSIDTSTYFDRTGKRGRSMRPVRIDNAVHAPLGAVRWRWHDTATTESIWNGCGNKGMDCCDTR